jgi:chromosome segregation protein
MHLKQINMENFKSFGHKVSVPFEGGFTAVTGPNGSGKSNISDSILFVLGPRSAKAIRAGKLSDLIFNGGGTGKPPAKFCWVELVFDNSDRMMPIESEEVRLRRLIRMSTQKKGEYNSYFYINDRASSLNEFDALLAHARISAEGYNLVQQGDINRITAMSNLERRRILDDIAGITRFDEDIDSANKKRAQAEENMGRIQLVLEEVKRNINILEKDKDAAAKYKDLQDRLALGRAQLAHLDVEEARDEVDQARRKEEECKEDLEKFSKELAKLKAELASTVKDYDAAEAAIAELGGGASKERRAKLETLTVDIAKADQRAEKAKESLDEARQLRKQLASDLKKMERDLQLAEKQRLEAVSERDRLQKELDLSRKELDGWRSNAARTDKDVGDLQRLAALKAKDVQGAQKERHEGELELDRLASRLGQGDLLLKELDEKVKSQQLQVADAEFQMGELKNTTSGAKGTLERLQKRLAELRREEKELTEDSVKAEREVTELTRQFGAMRAEAEAQLGIERGYVRSVSDVLSARSKGELKGIRGTVAELAKVDNKYERALETAAGSRMQAIVVDDDGAAAAAIAHLKKTKSGRAIFLPLNKLRVTRPQGKSLMIAKEPDVVGFAIDLVKYDEKYESAMTYTFGDTLVVKTLDAARRLMGGVRLVTLEGDLIEAVGAMVGGAAVQSNVKFGTSGASPLDQLRRQLEEATDRSNKLAEAMKTCRQELVRVEDELRQTGGSSGDARSKISTLESTRGAASKILSGIAAERDQRAKALAADLKRKAELEKTLDKFTKDLESLEGEREDAAKKAVKAAPKEVGLKIHSTEKNVSDLATGLAEAKGRADTLETQMGVLREGLSKAKEEAKRLDAKAASAEREIEQAAEQSEGWREDRESLLQVDKSSISKLESAQKKRDDLYKTKTDKAKDAEGLDLKVETTQEVIGKLQDEIRTGDTRLIQAEENLKTLELKVKLPLPPRDEVQATVTACEKKMQAMGGVNLRALTDFDGEVQRRDAMEGELKDLRGQMDALAQTVEELNKKKKFGLFKVFDAINANFKGIYAELSQGGSAELILENPEEPFQGGLAVRAQPRGKKVLRIESLSGGEKSLTALSLIFSIQQFQPSPFYLLDEVDMFLDAVNAESVARMVKKNSATAQFVMISLRKVTLGHADHLYGVTMMGKGVSEVIGNVSIGALREDTKAGIVLQAAAH